MTDLLTRIRAYVAEMPTHECEMCRAEFDQLLSGRCPECGSSAGPRVRTETAADALLREVAALEPVGYIWPTAVYVLQSGERTHEVLWAKPTRQAGMPLYTLTGATHAPE